MLMTTDQAYTYVLLTYPNMLVSPTIDNSKYEFYDHVFNTIGNGFNTYEEFVSYYTTTDKALNVIKKGIPNKYISYNKLYYVYTKFTSLDTKIKFKMPDQSSVLDELYTLEEIESNKYFNKDDVAIIQANNHTLKDFDKGIPVIPYPNFKKEHSLVWYKGFEQVEKSWIHAAIWYYTKSLDFFNSDQACNYHGAYNTALTNAFIPVIERYKTQYPNIAEMHNAITNDYGHPYNGDLDEFLKSKWEVQLAEIKSFIGETLTYLNTLL